MIPALIGAAASLGGAFLQNEFSQSNVSDANSNANANSAKAWERSTKSQVLAQRMSTNAYKKRYQWTTRDMRKAGLNPILAATGGYSVTGQPQSSAPSSAAAQTFQAPTPNFNIASSAKDVAQAQQAEEQTKLTQKQALTEVKKAIKITKENRVLTQQEALVIEQTALAMEQNAKANAEWKLTNEQRKQTELLNTRLRSLLKKIGKQGQVYDNAYGTILTYIRETLGSIGALISGVPVQLLKP